MDPKTIIGIALVVFIIAGLLFLRFRKKKQEINNGRHLKYGAALTI